MTTPDADLDLAAMASSDWARCPHVDPDTGLRCDFLGKRGDDHQHAVYHPADLNDPPWHRRIVSFAEAADIEEARRWNMRHDYSSTWAVPEDCIQLNPFPWEAPDA